MNKYKDYVYETGTNNPVVGVIVTVYIANTTTPATLYSNSGLVTTAPIMTDQTGYFEFWTVSGSYDLYVLGDKYYTISVSELTDVPDPLVVNSLTTGNITLGTTAITASGTEINYADGVTSPIQPQINAIATGQASGVVGYATLALMTADTTQPEGTVGLVTNDPTPLNNTYYLFTGGVWVVSDIVFGAITVLSTYGSLAAAVTAIGATPKTLHIDVDDTVSADLTVPETLQLVPINGAIITVSTGQVLTINSAFDYGPIQCFAGAGRVIGLKEARPEWWSTTGGIKEAVEAISMWGGKVTLISKTYTEPATITNFTRDILIQGAVGERNSNTPATDITTGAASIHGTAIIFSGTGAFFENGEDNGLPYDELPGYDGIQGVYFNDVSISVLAANLDTPLSNAYASYGAGTYGFRDWRGGHIRFNNVVLQGFEYGFWGVHSDVNKFDSVSVRLCKIGIYAGPRCDQFNIEDLYGALCDQAIVIDGCAVNLIRPNIVGCGYETLYPIEIKRVTNIGPPDAYGVLRNVNIDSAWLEKYQGYAGKVNAFIGVGINDGYLGSTGTANYPPRVSIRDTMFITNQSGNANGWCENIVEMNRGIVIIDNITGQTSISGFKALSLVGDVANGDSVSFTKPTMILYNSNLQGKEYVSAAVGYTPIVQILTHGYGGGILHTNNYLQTDLGLVFTTPDLSKQYLITIDNSGVLTSTLIT